MDRRRTSEHSGACAGSGRSQLRIQAFQASCSASSAKPGSSDQRTGVQRLLPMARAGGNGALSSRANGGAAAGPGAGAGGRTTEGARGADGARSRGGAAQPASIPRIRARRKTRDMLWILLEAIAALVLLLLIVWWTMFSGRREDEPHPEDDAER